MVGHSRCETARVIEDEISGGDLRSLVEQAYLRARALSLGAMKQFDADLRIRPHGQARAVEGSRLVTQAARIGGTEDVRDTELAPSRTDDLQSELKVFLPDPEPFPVLTEHRH